MRLSEAIALGRILVRPKAGAILHGDGSGCALGMAAIADGMFKASHLVTNEDYEILKAHWPLLSRRHGQACKCPYWGVGDGTQIIAHLFDYHVSKYKDWTLDQLIDWVRKKEPADEEKPVPAEAKTGRVLVPTVS